MGLPLLLLALIVHEAPSCQDDDLKSVTITKQERSTYLPAVNKFKDAEKLLDSDPAGAIDKCTEVIDDKNVKDANREIRIRIQNTDGTYGEWTVFLPYQLRGRARLARAKALGTKARGDAIQMAQDAIKDLAESDKRGAHSSKPFVKQAEELIAKLKDAGSTDPDPRTVRAEGIMKDLRKAVDSGAAPDDVIQRCDAAAADVKGTPFENELALIRDRAVKARDAAKSATAAEKAIQQLRDLVKSKPGADAILKKCDELAPALEGTAYDGELKLIRKDALDERVDSFRRDWRALLEQEKFKSALKFVDTGAFLEDAERRKFKDDTARACRRLLDSRLERFQRNLKDLLPADNALAALKRGDLDALVLPAPDELLESDPALDWGRAFKALLKEPDFEKIAAAASDAIALKVEGENRSFTAAEALAYDMARRRVEKAVEESASASAAVRKEKQAEAAGLVRRMKELSARADDDFRKRHEFVAVHLKTLESLLEKFPVDVARIDEIGKALAEMKDPAPMVALEMLEKELARIWKTEGPRLARESRQKLGTWLIVASATRHLLAGAKPADVAKRDDVREYVKIAGDVGGPIAEAMSPKVAKVAELAK